MSLKKLVAGNWKMHGLSSDLDEIRREAVHLPIAGNELAERHSHPLLREALAARLDARHPAP